MILGVDGGGTSTTAWLADRAGTVIGKGTSGPSNLRAIGPEAAKASLDLAIARAFDDASLERSRVTLACLGLAGFDRSDERQLLENWSADSGWATRLLLKNDGDLVVAAGTPEGWGVGVIAGTGSIAVGRSRDGKTARSGGWGYLIGDEGSGYTVALAGLRLVARRADGREHLGENRIDHLTERLCSKLGIADAGALIAAIYRRDFDRARIANLAPVVVSCADEDEAIVETILKPAGLDLARMASSVARQIGFSAGQLPLALAGSFLLNCLPVVQILQESLIQQGFELCVSTVAEPVAGAILLAKQALSS